MSEVVFPNLPDVFYKYFKKDEKEAKVQTEVTFAPSYLTDCGRKIYYKKTGEKSSNEITLPALFKMHFGTVQHAEMQRILKEVGILKSAEIHRKTEYKGLTFNYYYDGIIEPGILIEIKTIYGAGFRAVEDFPKEEHIQQTLSYMHFETIDKAIILYVGRDNGLLRQHTISLFEDACYVNFQKTDELEKWRNNIEKMRKLKTSIENKELPQRDYQIALKNSKGVITDEFQKDSKRYKSDWQCQYCPFKETCWKLEYEQMKDKLFYINGKFE